MAAVDKIEDERKPEDFIGHRNRKSPLATGGNLWDCWQLPILVRTRLAWEANMREIVYVVRLFGFAFFPALTNL